jgi:hypothetical protein
MLLPSIILLLPCSIDHFLIVCAGDLKDKETEIQWGEEVVNKIVGNCQ